MLGRILKIFWCYEEDKIKGRPAWRDRGFLGLIAGLAAAILASYAHIHIAPDMQAALITLIAGAFHLSQRHVGIVRRREGGNQKTSPRNVKPQAAQADKPSTPNFGW